MTITTTGTSLRRRARGVSLIELMIAMTIGLILMIGAVTVYSKARDAYASIQVTARLQESAQYAMALLESDLRMAGYLGLMSRPELVSNLNQTLVDPALAAVSLSGGCAANWATDLDNFVTGWDNAYLPSGCASYGTRKDGTDSIVVRRASANRLPLASLGPSASHVLVVTSRTSGQVFVGNANGDVPAGFVPTDTPSAPPFTDVREMLVHGYYVSQDSTAQAGFPSLRRKRLVAGPAVQDEEIMPGVEDLQVQYGVDVDGDRNADRFVNANSLTAGDLIVAVRVWLRIRARERDVAWSDTQTYTYANQNQSVPSTERQFRRLVVSKTFQLRNARAI